MTKQAEHLKAIKVHKTTCDKLDAIRHLGQSYDGIIRELLNKYHGNGGNPVKLAGKTPQNVGDLPFKPQPKPNKK